MIYNWINNTTVQCPISSAKCVHKNHVPFPLYHAQTHSKNLCFDSINFHPVVVKSAHSLLKFAMVQMVENISNSTLKIRLIIHELHN